MYVEGAAGRSKKSKLRSKRAKSNGHVFDSIAGISIFGTRFALGRIQTDQKRIENC